LASELLDTLRPAFWKDLLSPTLSLPKPSDLRTDNVAVCHSGLVSVDCRPGGKCWRTPVLGENQDFWDLKSAGKQLNFAAHIPFMRFHNAEH
jgi:hypothetical protein